MSKLWVFGDYSQAEARVVAWAGPIPALKGWFQRGEDVHTHVAQMIARVVQENHVVMGNRLFTQKPFNEYGKGDPERDVAKNTVYGNNYGMGPTKFALIVGLPEREAKVLQEIYFSLFPEVRTGYQARIATQLRETRTIKTPLGREKRFYGMFDEEMKRAAYSYYAQSTVGDLLTDVVCDLCELGNGLPQPPLEYVKDRLDPLPTPDNLRSIGMDIRLQIHDAIGVCVENDLAIVEWTLKTIKRVAERPIIINDDPMVIPMDFKLGRSWGTAKEVKLDDGTLSNLFVGTPTM